MPKARKNRLTTKCVAQITCEMNIGTGFERHDETDVLL